jgi:hypothetical protein
VIGQVGQNVYAWEPEAAEQISSRQAQIGEKTVYFVEVQNDGAVADSFLLTAPEAPQGWSAQYFDAVSSGNDVTTALTGEAGWETVSLAPQAKITLRVEVIAQAMADVDAPFDLQISGASSNDKAIIDRVTAQTTLATLEQLSGKGDLEVKSARETLYLGAEIYDIEGNLQSKTLGALGGKTATYHIRLTNRENHDVSFVLTGNSAGEGWTVRYFDSLQEGVDITAEMENSGWASRSLAAGGSLELLVEVTATDPINILTSCPLLIRVLQDDVVSDGIKITTVLSNSKVDATIKPQDSEAFIGEDIFNTSGVDQTVNQNIAATEPATFIVKIHNKGDHSEPFTILGLRSDQNRIVQYFDAATGGTDITSSVTVNGWATRTLAPGENQEIRVVISLIPPTSPVPNQIFAGLYHVHTVKVDAGGGLPDVRDYNMILSAEDVTRVIQGENVGPAHLAIGDPCVEMQVDLTPTSVAPAVLVQVSATLDTTQVDTVQAVTTTETTH